MILETIGKTNMARLVLGDGEEIILTYKELVELQKELNEVLNGK